MLSYLRTPGCRMEYLRRSSMTPTRSRAAGATTAPGTRGPRRSRRKGPSWRGPGCSVRASTSARAGCGRPGMKRLGVDVAGKIPAELSADTGRALGRLTGLGWGPRLRALLDRRPGADAPVPGDLVAALVQVLAAWDWEQRPAGVVTLPSPYPAPAHRQPGRADRGDRAAAVAGLPGYARPGPGAGQASSTAPSGSRRSGASCGCPGRWPRRSPRSAARCWSSTTASRAAGP